jgi:heme-degrading monooxygenase HmoA
MFMYLSEFQVKPKWMAEFRETYSSTGRWVKLFSEATGYIYTELHRDVDDENRYITIDYWQSKHDYDVFREQFKDKYEKLDSECELFTKRERHLGSFERVTIQRKEQK